MVVSLHDSFYLSGKNILSTQKIREKKKNNHDLRAIVIKASTASSHSHIKGNQTINSKPNSAGYLQRYAN